MKLYRVPLVLHEPSKDTEDKYLAEAPGLPGCRAWGDTAAEALENLQSVATAFIESYRSKGDALPHNIETASEDVPGPTTLSELLVAV